MTLSPEFFQAPAINEREFAPSPRQAHVHGGRVAMLPCWATSWFSGHLVLISVFESWFWSWLVPGMASAGIRSKNPRNIL